MEAAKGFSIQIASKVSGVGIHTIRAWERRYGTLHPDRDASGRRIYSEADIEKLTLLNDLCKMGHSIRHIAPLESDKLKDIRGKFEKVEKTRPQAAEDQEPFDAQEVLGHLISALEHYKLDIISHEISKIKKTLNLKKVVFEILVPLLNRVGVLVDQGILSIAQEHSLSSILKFHLGHVIYHHVQKPQRNQHKIVLSTPCDEHHEFGILMAALLCCHYGLDFGYLGVNLPAESLLEAADALDAGIIILGTSQAMDQESHKLDNYLEKVVRGLQKQQKVWVGGMGAFDIEHFQKIKNFTHVPSLTMLDRLLSNG